MKYIYGTSLLLIGFAMGFITEATSSKWAIDKVTYSRDSLQSLVIGMELIQGVNVEQIKVKE